MGKRFNRFYKKRRAAMLFIAVLFAALSGFWTQPAFAAEGFTTQSYSVVMDVSEDNSFQIKETIRVNFYEDRHGIYLYIPYKGSTTYQEEDGSTVTQRTNMKIDNVSVEGYEYDVYRENGNVVIQIGSPDYTVSGLQTYEISYQCRLYDDRNEAYDSLYWEVIPSTWKTPVERAEVTIRMPKAFDPKMGEFLAGAYGSAGGIPVDWSVSGTTVTAAVSALASYEGVNCRFVLPEGYFAGEMTVTWALLAMVGVMAAAPVLSLLLWLLFGRDPKVVKTVEFYPPDGISPAEVGYIIDGKVDQKDLVSMVIYFAEQGYLAIEEREKESFTLVKLTDLPEDAKAYEHVLFDGLFNYGQKEEVALNDLGEDFGSTYQAAADQLKAYFTANKENRVFTHTSVGARAAGILLMAVPSAAAAIFGGIYSMQLESAFIAGLGTALLLIGYSLLIYTYDRKYSTGRATSTVLRILGTLIAILGLAAVAGYLVVTTATIAGAVLSVAASVTCFLCTMLMKQRTKKSARQLGKILGFKEFIRTAELDRIQRLAEENPSYFYSALPYAYVFGLTDKWAKKFETIATAPPAWYHTAYGDPFFNTWIFIHAFNVCTASMSSHLRVPPVEMNSSGGGFGAGGGFVGGGFGGGRGGGSW